MRVGFLLSLIFLAGCTSPIAVAVDEEDANRIVVALDRASIEASKEVDPGAEGKYRIVVPREESGHALGILRDEELPRARFPGVLEAMDKNSLVPSIAAEHAQLVAGLSGDLQRTLEGVDGVLSARVHLNLPSSDRARDVPVKSSASVLVSYRTAAAAPPLADTAVQRLVAGGVPGLSPADVAVVMIARPAASNAGVSPLVRIGPFVVARTSVRSLEYVLSALVALLIAFCASTIVFYTRLTRLRADTAAAPPKTTRTLTPGPERS